MVYTKKEQAATDAMYRAFRHQNSRVKAALEADKNTTSKIKERYILNDAYKNMLINLPREELSITNINRLFAYTTPKGTFNVREPIIHTTATCTLKAGEFTNKEEVQTTAGSILFNKLFIAGKVDQLMKNGYVNDIITNKVFGKILDTVGESYRENLIDVDTIIRFLNDFEFYGLHLVTTFSPSFTHNILKPHPEVVALRNKLVAKLPPDPSVAEIVNIENECTALAAKLSNGDPGMSLYDSGSRGSFDNDYKCISIMIGPAVDPATNKPNMITNNLIDGIAKKDIPSMGTAVVAASYPKAVGTQVGGYLTKQFYAVYQAITVDEDGTDCGTTKGLVRTLTEENYKNYMYQNVMLANGKHVTITNAVKDKLINKRVIIRSPMYCKNEKICSVCAGRTPYDLDMKNIGLNAGSISNTLMNKRMKAFHETKVHFNQVNLDDLII